MTKKILFNVFYSVELGVHGRMSLAHRANVILNIKDKNVYTYKSSVQCYVC